MSISPDFAPPSHGVAQDSASLQMRLSDGTATVGILGLGYVGLPLAVEMARSGYRTLGFDINAALITTLNRGQSHIQDVPSEVLRPLANDRLFSATSDLSYIAACDAISICVPTPLNKIKDPDLSYVVSAAETIRSALRPGQLIILESTMLPGTTRDVVLPILERSGLVVGEDVFLCYSPERVDPGNAVWHTKNTPKVLGGITEACARLGVTLYDQVFETIIPVESAEAAELIKVYENTFRLINTALANELAQVCDRLGVDVWGVIEAAATKPVSFMEFTPGPGLGAHCIPLDTHCLSWKMRARAYKTRMIELAGEINAEMPAFVVGKAQDALNENGKAMRGSRVLVLGVAYKKDIDDLRASPAIEIIRLLQDKGAEVLYHDPFCPIIPDDGHTLLSGLPMRSVRLDEAMLRLVDVVIVATDHSAVSYRMVAEHARLVVDTRGVMRNYPGTARVVGLSGREQRHKLVADEAEVAA